MTKRILSAVVGCAVIAACSSGVQTSIPGSSTISSLSVEQTRQLCRDRAKYTETVYSISDRTSLACNIGAAIAGAFGSIGGPDAGASTCQKSYDECKVAPATASDGGTTDSCAMVMADSSCTATVADLNSCFVEQLEALRPLTKSAYVCGALSTDGGSPLTTKSTTCDKIAPTCERAKTLSW